MHGSLRGCAAACQGRFRLNTLKREQQTNPALPDVYVRGGMITLRGGHLKLDPHDPNQGVFCILEDGTVVRCEHYARINRLQATALMPEGVSGPIQLRVASYIHGGVRSILYPVTLQEVPAPVIG